MRRPLQLMLLVAPALARGQGVNAERATPERGAGGTTDAARPAPPPGLPERGEWSVGGWAGGASTSYSGHFIGATPGRGLALVGIRLGLASGRIGPVAVEYVGQLIPAAFAYDNPVAPLTDGCGSRVTVTRGRRTTTRVIPGFCQRRVYGAGALPIGVQLATALGPHARAFVAGHAGGLVFVENVPVTTARRLNFAFDFGGGLEIGGRRGGAVTVGYKLHHISNAWTAESNPGIDHHVIYLGFVHRLRTARHGATAAPR